MKLRVIERRTYQQRNEAGVKRNAYKIARPNVSNLDAWNIRIIPPKTFTHIVKAYTEN